MERRGGWERGMKRSPTLNVPAVDPDTADRRGDKDNLNMNETNENREDNMTLHACTFDGFFFCKIHANY